MHPYLSVIIPAYNEEKRLPKTLQKVQRYLAQQSYQYEVVVVDDGSRDKTVQVVSEMEPTFPQLRLITNTENKGKGGVVQQGMLLAQGRYRLFMDADLSTPLEEVSALLKYVAGYEVIIGSRHLNPTSIKVKQPLKRRIISKLSNWLIQLSVLPGIKDTQCGFKLFSAQAAEAIFPQQTITRWLFDVEILAIAKELGYAIKEVPVEWSDSANSTLRASRAVTNSLKELWKIWQNVRQHKYRSHPTHG